MTRLAPLCFLDLGASPAWIPGHTGRPILASSSFNTGPGHCYHPARRDNIMSGGAKTRINRSDERPPCDRAGRLLPKAPDTTRVHRYRASSGLSRRPRPRPRPSAPIDARILAMSCCSEKQSGVSAYDTASTLRACRAGPTSFLAKPGLSCSATATSGTAGIGGNCGASWHADTTPTIGLRRLPETGIATGRTTAPSSVGDGGQSDSGTGVGATSPDTATRVSPSAWIRHPDQSARRMLVVPRHERFPLSALPSQ